MAWVPIFFVNGTKTGKIGFKLRSQKLSETIAASILVSRPSAQPAAPPPPCYPRPPIALDECISRRRRDRFQILPRFGVCERTKKIVIELEYFSNWQSSNGRARPTIDHSAAVNSFSLFCPLSLPPSLSLQISWPTAKNQSARFFPLVSSTTIVDSILSLSLSLFARFVKIRRPSIRVPRGQLSQLRLVAISARNVFLDNEFPSIDPFYFP